MRKYFQEISGACCAILLCCFIVACGPSLEEVEARQKATEDSLAAVAQAFAADQEHLMEATGNAELSSGTKVIWRVIGDQKFPQGFNVFTVASSTDTIVITNACGTINTVKL